MIVMVAYVGTMFNNIHDSIYEQRVWVLGEKLGPSRGVKARGDERTMRGLEGGMIGARS